MEFDGRSSVRCYRAEGSSSWCNCQNTSLEVPGGMHEPLIEALAERLDAIGRLFDRTSRQ